MSRNPEYKKLINTTRWSKLRKEILKEHPICEECGEEAANFVHHKIPVESVKDLDKMEELCFTRSNLEAVCKKCHENLHIRLHKQLEGKARKFNETSEGVNEFLLDFLGIRQDY